MKQKGFTPILIVLLIAAVVGGYFVYQNQTKPTPPPQQPFDNTQGKPTQPSPTPAEEIVYTEASQSANWKIYTNEKYGFSFKYPDSYFKYSSENPQFGLYLAPREGNGEERGTPLGLNSETDVWLDANVIINQDIDIEEFINSQINSSEGAATKSQKIIIGNQKGYKLLFDKPYGPQGVYSYQISIKKGRNIYRINLFAFRKEVLHNNEQTFNQILSTFRFD